MRGQHDIKAIAYLWGTKREPEKRELDSEALCKLFAGEESTRTHILALQQYIPHTSEVRHKISLTPGTGIHRHTSTVSTPLGRIQGCEEAVVQEPHTVHTDSVTRIQTQLALEHIERQSTAQVTVTHQVLYWIVVPYCTMLRGLE